MSEQREYCKAFLRVYRLRMDQNLSCDIAWASAEAAAGRKHPLERAELEEVPAWQREKVKTVWRRSE